MEEIEKISTLRKVFGFGFFLTGIFNILGVIFSANGASIGVGIFNTIVGFFILKPLFDEVIKNLKK
jgi:hypothetical protein